MITINKGDAKQFQDKLLARCAFPQIQDTEDNIGWDTMGGGKDDFYIYDAQGKLTHFFHFKGEVETNLSKEEGYNNMKMAIKEVFEAQQ